MLLSPTAIDKLFEEEENDAPFPDSLVDLSGTWDLGMQSHPHCLPQGVNDNSTIPDIMLGVDVPTHGILLPLRDISTAEMPPNVTVTLKRKRSKQQASMGHLTKVMGTMTGPEKTTLHATAAPSHKAEPGPAPDSLKHSRARVQQDPSDQTPASPPTQPPPKRQRSAPRPSSQQHERFSAKRPRSGPTARPRGAGRPADAAAAAPAPAPAVAALKRRSLQPVPEEVPRRHSPADVSEGRLTAMKEEPQAPQRRLRRRGRMPARLAAIRENERSPGSQDSGVEEDCSGSDEGASPSAVTGCKLSKAACRAQGALHQLTHQEVLEAEAELGPDPTEEEREAAYRRVKNRSAARKTRRKKVETVRKLQEQVQHMGKHNRDLISRLKKLIVQVEVYSRENAQLKGLLQYLQFQPEGAAVMPS